MKTLKYLRPGIKGEPEQYLRGTKNGGGKRVFGPESLKTRTLGPSVS